MVQRCHVTSSKDYNRYGARGISVCCAWRSRPHAFLRWCDQQGTIPSGHTLDRENNNGNYSPGNCRFTSKEEQNNNSRSNVMVRIGGERLTLTRAVRKHGVVKYQTAYRRIKVYGWNRAKAVTTPAESRKFSR